MSWLKLDGDENLIFMVLSSDFLVASCGVLMMPNNYGGLTALLKFKKGNLINLQQNSRYYSLKT